MWETKALPNRGLSDSQLTSHRWAIRILTEDLGARKLRSLSPDHAERLVAELAAPAPSRHGRRRPNGTGLSRPSLIKMRSTLNQALKWAQRRDLVMRNIAPLVEIPASAATSKSGRSLNLAQANAFLMAAAGTDFEAMWIAMLDLGLRLAKQPRLLGPISISTTGSSTSGADER